MMRIAYIGDGGSVHNHFMLNWFVRQGHEVILLTDTPASELECEVKLVAPRQGNWLRHVQAVRAIRSSLKAWKPDIVHAHNITGYGYWGAASGFQPLVMTAWGTDLLLQAQESRWVRNLVRWSLRRAQLITADAQSLAEEARQLAGNRTPVRMLQWGIDLSELNQPIDPQWKEELRGGARFVFLSNRRLRPIYNIDVIIKAFAEVAQQVRDVRLVVVGDDWQKPDLQALVQKLGIEAQVTFTGWLDRGPLMASLRCTDAYLSVPSSDSTPLSLLEAFAAGLPVITSDLPALREWIVPNQNGYLTPPGDVCSLAEAMRQLAAHPDQARQVGSQNRALVDERANRDREMSRLLSWYRELTGV